MTIAEVLTKAKEVLKSNVSLCILILCVVLSVWFLNFTGRGRDIAFKVFRAQIAAQEEATRATYEDQIKRLNARLESKDIELRQAAKHVRDLESKVKAYEIKRGNIKPAKNAADLQARFKERGYYVEIR